MDKTHSFQFGYLTMRDGYAVITCDEGVNIGFDEISEIKNVLDLAYAGEQFGLIANRENIYSVNPQAINELFSRDNLVAGAIVGKAMTHAINAAFENTFVSGATIKYFYDMAPAVAWIEAVIDRDNVIH